MFEQYADDIGQYELFPNGKAFRIIYDPSVNKMKLLAVKFDLFNEIRDAFSCENPSAFFVHQYGYKVENKLYAINKFGYFSVGLIWEVLVQIKTLFGSLDVVAMSKNCISFIND